MSDSKIVNTVNRLCQKIKDINNFLILPGQSANVDVDNANINANNLTINSNSSNLSTNSASITNLSGFQSIFLGNNNIEIGSSNVPISSLSMNNNIYCFNDYLVFRDSDGCARAYISFQSGNFGNYFAQGATDEISWVATLSALSPEISFKIPPP